MTARDIAYSTDPLWCPKCRHLPCDCKGKPSPESPLASQTAKIRLEKSGRRGKAVTVVFNISAGEAALRDLLRTLQKDCGTGGTLKNGTLEIQGDHRDRIEERLKSLGLKVKRAGG